MPGEEKKYTCSTELIKPSDGDSLHSTATDALDPSTRTFGGLPRLHFSGNAEVFKTRQSSDCEIGSSFLTCSSALALYVRVLLRLEERVTIVGAVLTLLLTDELLPGSYVASVTNPKG